MSRHVKEVETILLGYPLRTSAHVPEDYIGGGQSKLRYLGVRSPHMHEIMRKGFSFYEPDRKAVAKAWEEIWHASDCYDVMALALSWFDHPKQRAILRDHWPMLKKWSERIDNWAHSDVLSGIYARILEEDPALVYPTLQKWNRHKNPWLRRLSIVSLLYYSSQRKNPPPLAKIVALVEPQIEFDHYYVQKGVGWTLREMGNVYPKETYRFLEKNIRRLSAAAFSAATEKLSKPQKDRLKELRKKR